MKTNPWMILSLVLACVCGFLVGLIVSQPAEVSAEPKHDWDYSISISPKNEMWATRWDRNAINPLPEMMYLRLEDTKGILPERASFYGVGHPNYPKTVPLSDWPLSEDSMIIPGTNKQGLFTVEKWKTDADGSWNPIIPSSMGYGTAIDIKREEEKKKQEEEKEKQE